MVRINLNSQNDLIRLAGSQIVRRAAQQHVAAHGSVVFATRVVGCVVGDWSDRGGARDNLHLKHANERTAKLRGEVIRNTQVGQCFTSRICNGERVSHVEVANGSTSRRCGSGDNFCQFDISNRQRCWIVWLAVSFGIVVCCVIRIV